MIVISMLLAIMAMIATAEMITIITVNLAEPLSSSLFMTWVVVIVGAFAAAVVVVVVAVVAAAEMVVVMVMRLILPSSPVN